MEEVLVYTDNNPIGIYQPDEGQEPVIVKVESRPAGVQFEDLPHLGQRYIMLSLMHC